MGKYTVYLLLFLFCGCRNHFVLLKKHYSNGYTIVKRNTIKEVPEKNIHFSFLQRKNILIKSQDKKNSPDVIPALSFNPVEISSKPEVLINKNYLLKNK